MKKNIFCLIVCLNLINAYSQTKNAYLIFSNKGENVGYETIVKNSVEADVIFFGELHDNPIAHWLQFELTSDLYEIHGQNLVLGAEMFETDNQLILSEYVSGVINQKRFEDEAKLWPNYKTDYKPLVEFAAKNKLLFIATNVPRRYASMVSSGGFEALGNISSEAKILIAPLPIEYDPELPGYKSMLKMDGMASKGNANIQNLPKAQALKDATMAWSISKNIKADGCFLHFNGAYHSNNHEGIIWYLKRLNPDLKIVTISTVVQKDISVPEKENEGLADFIIVIPETMSRTY